MKITKEAIVVGYKTLTRLLSKNSPTILTAIGTGLMVAGVVVTIVNAPKAKDEIDILEEDEEISHKEYVKDKARIIVRYYWPTTAMTFGGAGLIFWGHKISLGRTAAALAAYQMAKDDLTKLENKIIDLDGEKHLEKAKEEINKDRVNNMSFTGDEVIQTGKGNMLFVDSITGQPFRSSFDALNRAETELNAEIHRDSELTAPLNTWLDLIGCRDSKVGDKLGWRFNRQGENVKIKYRCVNKPNEEVYHVIEYNVAPIWDFDIIESSDRSSGYDW